MHENRIMEPVKIAEKGVGKIRNEYYRGWIYQRTGYTCVEISQWNPFAQLICTIKYFRKMLFVQM
jgi:hypothetical protein